MSNETAITTTPADDSGMPVLCRKVGAMGHILLNRPRTLNALDLEMIDAMAEQLADWENDPSVAVVVIEGAGEKAFCAGGDIRGLYNARQAGDEELLDAFYRREYALNHYIANYPKPYVALMDGITMGGGVGVSIHGRYRVVTERTLFAMPETGIGFFPDVGGGYFLPRCPGQIGMYLGLTGARIKAADCQYAGLATHGAESAVLADMKTALADADYSNDPFAAVERILGKTQKDFGGGVLAGQRARIDALFSGASIIEIFKALERETDDFAKETLKVLYGKSPSALCVTFDQIRQGANMSLDDDLVMEYRLSQRMVCKPDLFEGVRAVIVDKDHDPKWQHREVGQVDPREIAEYFELLPEDRELKLPAR